MAILNGTDQFAIKAFLKGDNGKSTFIRYSEWADGTDFTETWSLGQNYIGFATAQQAPTDKSLYTWCKFTEDFGALDNALDAILEIQNALIGGATE